ncbi:DUF262 domain-containing protein [Herpetosiphon sp. NSE202]|uniref:DUF262 domain-containing protein n=1 Tax=Herpetosiphon sp. NSE202 TaxID=3351349 RepID=UPI003644622E
MVDNNEDLDLNNDDEEELPQGGFQGFQLSSQAALYGLSNDIEEEEEDDDELIITPFNPSQIRIDFKPMTVDLLISRMENNEIDMQPAFQRQAGLWTREAQSRLIESILIRIPLPAFYMDATNEDRWIIVDGLQRLTTLYNFILAKKNHPENQLKLKGLEFLNTITDKGFDDLPRNFQRRIMETQVLIYQIAPGTPEEVKFNIFKRINTGGLPLSPQEIRHALHQGRATELLKRMAEFPEFKQATTNSVPTSRMSDREFVLRFIAFHLVPPEKYNRNEFADFDSFLSNTMATINKLDQKALDSFEQQFRRAMRAAKAIFDKDAFRKRYKANASRGMINKSLFESWSVNLSNCSDDQIKVLVRRKNLLMQKFIAMLNHDREFDKAISQGTGDTNKVNIRFRRIAHLIQEVLK